MSEGSERSLFVVTLPAGARDPQAYSLRAREEGADLLELRGDLTADLPAFESALPLLVAPRGAGRGFLERFPAAWVDLEDGEALDFPAGVRRIRSFHDHEKTPSDDEMRARVARLAVDCEVVKVAVRARSFADLGRLEALRDGWPPSAAACLLAMGPLAWPNRMRSAVRNALTYACLEPKDAVAEGQMPLAVHRQSDGGGPRLYGIIGGPGLRSLSPLIHNALFARHEIDAFYGLLPTDDAVATLGAARRLGFGGLSITAPWKQRILPTLDETSAEADLVGAVNTVLVRGSRLVGHQFDVHGLVCGYDFLRGRRRAAIVGSGGVVPAVIEALRRCGIPQIGVHARNAAALAAIAGRFGVETGGLEGLAESRPDLLVWALPLDLELELPLAPKPGFAIDLRYGRTTDFLAAAGERGYRTFDGLPMLLHQALAQFEAFTGIPSTGDDLEFLEEVIAGHGQQQLR